jgi:hypothetical protein
MQAHAPGPLFSAKHLFIDTCPWFDIIMNISFIEKAGGWYECRDQEYPFGGR